MGLNRAFDRSFFVIGGAVKTSGGSLNLAKGQLAVIDQSVTTKDGAKVVTSFAGKPKKAKDFVIRTGIAERGANRSYSNKDESSMPFALSEVTGLRVSAPKLTEQTVDEVVIGYDGINPNSGFKFQTNDSYFRLSLELCGDIIGFKGGTGATEMVNINVEVPSCDDLDNCVDCDGCAEVDCKAITLEAIERLKRKQLQGGMLVEEVVDITPVFSCDNDVTATLIPYDYYTLTVCDSGSDEAEALVKAQYNAPVKRINRLGADSVYQILLPQTEGAPADYSQSIASLIKGCEDCPAGYSEVEGGILYAITMEDDGSSQVAALQTLPAVVGSTVKKYAGQDAGVGFYTAVFTRELTDAEIAAFVGGAGAQKTTTFKKAGTIASVCTNGTLTNTAWVVGDTCNAVEETYSITLKDTTCGANRLAELQGNFSDLEIAVAQEDSLNSSQDLTLTGASGDADITITGTGAAYQAVFNTDLATTANDFVTAHAATILSAEGLVVTADAGVLTFTGLTVGFPTITIANTTPDLGGTLGAVTVIPQDVVGGCQTKYSTKVISNLVCEECDPIFKDFYTTDAPESYENNEWEKEVDATTQPNGNCKCGIRIKGKTFILEGEEALRDIVGFTETSTKVRVSAGYPEEIREGIGQLPEGAYVGKYLSRWVPRTHLAGNLRDIENESRAYFRGLDYRKDYLGRILRGETSNMEDQMKQYVQYTVSVSHFSHTQGFAGRINEDIDYHIFVEVGRHNAVEDLLNNLAANAGVETVVAFPA